MFYAEGIETRGKRMLRPSGWAAEETENAVRWGCVDKDRRCPDSEEDNED